ncbi:MAG: sugar ABC transporter permease [Devosia sp. 67-54]|uniref:carbohydrate ABC transporter permease n=1 Tax=unclassified Devosia TaxID=196773 RepID=UPI00096260E3|nr:MULTISPECIES: carbohydrate ABC transporter permease [unclassified Devosia]MBN9304871.1 carbohydrate ABC transporter permease [Devosia sp.]OJX15177.1 MAG: sugar ABC transporter permease [Devosia sp. 67-54]
MKLAAFLKTLPGWVVLLLWAIAVGLPLYALVVSCFKSTAEIYADPLGLPARWGPDNFITAWTALNLGRGLINSLVVTVCAVVATVLVSAMAAYPLSRYDLKWGPWMLLLFLAGIMLPIRLASVELFNLVKAFGLIDSLFGLILVYIAIRIPFAVFIFANFMRTLPRELEEAARIDGAGEVRILFQVILPMVWPAAAIVAIFTAIAVWNDFFFPLIFIFSDENKTIPLTIASFIGQFRTDWGSIFASLAISLAPVLAMYLLMARQIREGIGTTGAVK